MNMENMMNRAAKKLRFNLNLPSDLKKNTHCKLVSHHLHLVQ